MVEARLQGEFTPLDSARGSSSLFAVVCESLSAVRLTDVTLNRRGRRALVGGAKASAFSRR
ncbi:hypothetical protein SBV1_2150002 [Verrucomicrobia bacterium]|nr:hypothetical protein SBV1_2150002 [Verrucomicrobiota bacterium]